MTARDNVALKNLIASNRRALQSLDDQLAYLNKRLEPDVSDNQKLAPFFYAAVGEDGLNGILLDPSPNREFTGRVVVQPDAAFVWTHVLAVQKLDAPVSDVGDKSFMGIWESAGGAFAKDVHNIDLGFADGDSGRALYQSERTLPDGTREPGQLISGSLFNTAEMYTARRGGFDAGVITEWAGGNGPNYARALPAQVLLAANSVVIARAKPNALDTAGAAEASRKPRVYVTLLGYKVEA